MYNKQEYAVVSQTSPSDATNKYCNVRILVFGLQIYKEITKTILKKNYPRCVKPLSDLSNYSYRNRTKRVAKSLFNDFESKKNKIWNLKNNSKFKETVIEADKQPWLIKFDKDQQLEKNKAQKIVQTINHSNILRKGYRALTITSYDLLKEWLVSREKHKIDKIMQKYIPLLEFGIKTQMQDDNSNNFNESNDSDDSDELDESDNLDNEKVTNILEK
ncbi:16952_t:CDS:2, partial [Dentiscutata erythropus]